MDTLPKSSHDGLIAPTRDADQDYYRVTAIDDMWEDVMKICLSLKSFRQSLLAKEPARLADMRAQVEDLKEVASHFKAAST